MGSRAPSPRGLLISVDLAIDRGGNLSFEATSEGTIFKFTPDGTKTTFASGHRVGLTAMAFDGAGNLFVGDMDSHFDP